LLSLLVLVVLHQQLQPMGILVENQVLVFLLRHMVVVVVHMEQVHSHPEVVVGVVNME
jgi:hypothetical protein